jgi:hypothetical protein
MWGKMYSHIPYERGRTPSMGIRQAGSLYHHRMTNRKFRFPLIQQGSHGKLKKLDGGGIYRQQGGLIILLDTTWREQKIKNLGGNTNSKLSL